MDGMAVISRGLASGKKGVGGFFQELGLNVETENEAAIAVSADGEISINVEVE